MKRLEDRRRAAAREKKFSSLAKDEAQGAAKRAKRETKANMPISAKDSRREAKIDMQWSKKRKKLANAIERKGD